jgi:predicted nucleic-acid-binding protein
MRITADTNVLVRAVVGDDPHQSLAASNVSLDRVAVEAGLAQLEAGGDFADAVIAHQGQCQGGDNFVSFDRQAVALLQQRGVAAELLG